MKTIEAIRRSQGILVERPAVTHPLVLEIQQLMRCCQEMIHQYYETDAPWSGPAWWLTFNQAGIRLREMLEEARRQRQQPLSDEELERAYLLLIRVAYFFEPDGVAEELFKEQRWDAGPKLQGVRDQPPV